MIRDAIIVICDEKDCWKSITVDLGHTEAEMIIVNSRGWTIVNHDTDSKHFCPNCSEKRTD